jgi:hypothetical protein
MLLRSKASPIQHKSFDNTLILEWELTQVK